MRQESLPVDGVTRCISAFFVGGHRGRGRGRSESEAARRDTLVHGPGSAMFAAAALDLLMVLHSRLPAVGKEEHLTATIPAQQVGRDAALASQLDTGVRPSGSRRTKDVECSDGYLACGALSAWMVILRTLSLGARSKERDVCMHALQLLTKV